MNGFKKSELSCQKKCKKEMKSLTSCTKKNCQEGIKKCEKMSKNNAKSVTQCVSQKCEKQVLALTKARKTKDFKQVMAATMELGKCVSENCKKNMDKMQSKMKSGLKCTQKHCAEEVKKAAQCKIDECNLFGKMPSKLKKSIKKALNRGALNKRKSSTKRKPSTKSNNRKPIRAKPSTKSNKSKTIRRISRR